MRLIGVIAAVLSAACGDNGGGGEAGECNDEWCQGDPAGSWTFAGAPCLAEPVESASCPAVTCTLRTASASGTLTLPADGQGAADFTASGTLGCTVPSACLGSADCDAIAQTCTPSATGCDCTLDFSTATTITGAWTRDDALGLLTIEDTATKQSWSTTNYCAADNSLDLKILAQQSYVQALGLVSIHLRASATAAD